jgi:hypothetical protein
VLEVWAPNVNFSVSGSSALASLVGNARLRPSIETPL